MKDNEMEPVWHVVKEVWDRNEKCVGSEVVSTYEEGDRVAFKAAAAEAKDLQDEHDAEPETEVDEVVTFSVSMW